MPLVDAPALQVGRHHLKTKHTPKLLEEVEKKINKNLYVGRNGAIRNAIR